MSKRQRLDLEEVRQSVNFKNLETGQFTLFTVWRSGVWYSEVNELKGFCTTALTQVFQVNSTTDTSGRHSRATVSQRFMWTIFEMRLFQKRVVSVWNQLCLCQWLTWYGSSDVDLRWAHMWVMKDLSSLVLFASSSWTPLSDHDQNRCGILSSASYRWIS